MVPMTFIWWIYHFWARFCPYFNFVDFRAFFGPFSLVNRDRQKMADLLRKMASNQKMQENKPTLKFNFTIEKRWPVSIFELFGPQHLSHWALVDMILIMKPMDNGAILLIFSWWCCVPGQVVQRARLSRSATLTHGSQGTPAPSSSSSLSSYFEFS